MQKLCSSDSRNSHQFSHLLFHDENLVNDLLGREPCGGKFPLCRVAGNHPIHSSPLVFDWLCGGDGNIFRTILQIIFSCRGANFRFQSVYPSGVSVKFFLSHLLLTFVWGKFFNDFSFFRLFLGFLLGWLFFYFMPFPGSHIYARKLLYSSKFLLNFFVEIVIANLQVAKAVLNPKIRFQPSFLAYPLKVQNDVEITLLANAITLTPGTISVEVSQDKKVLFIHALFGEDEEQVIRRIQKKLEEPILRIFGK